MTPVLNADYPKSNWKDAVEQRCTCFPWDGIHAVECPCDYDWVNLDFDALDRLTVRVGPCETDINRRADMELRRRGYTFDASQARWVNG